MIRILSGADDYVTAWVQQRIPWASYERCTAIGVMDDDRVIAGVVYSNFRGCDIEMSAAADDPRWMSPTRLAFFFGYPFQQLEVLRVTAVTEKRNKRARKLVERLGFVLEGTHPKAIDGRTACTYGMLREKCKWIRSPDYGREKQTETA